MITFREQKTVMVKKKNLAHIFCSVLLLLLLTCSQAFAFEIPISQTEQMIDGRQTLTKVFEVSADTDPATLVENNLAQNGYCYTMTSIVKDAVSVEDKKEITKEQSVTVNVSNEDNARLEAIMSMPAFIEYNEGGYIGKLYPVISSLTSEELGRTRHSGSKVMTKSYTYDQNDDSLVPASNNGYSLSSISWSDGNYSDSSTIPDNYVATATYSKPYSYSTVDGWVFKMSYVGDVIYDHEDVVRYTLTYIGSEIKQPGFIARLFGAKPIEYNTTSGLLTGVENGTNSVANNVGSTNVNAGTQNGNSASGFRAFLGVIFTLIALAAIGYAAYKVFMFIKNNRVGIYARDEVSGEYVKLKSVWFKFRKSFVNVDTLAMPSSQHFRVVFTAALAEMLKGKMVTIKAGQQIKKYQIGESSGADYVIDIALDV